MRNGIVGLVFATGVAVLAAQPSMAARVDVSLDGSSPAPQGVDLSVTGVAWEALSCANGCDTAGTNDVTITAFDLAVGQKSAKVGDVVVTVRPPNQPQPVPLPAALPLFAAGVAALAIAVRRRTA